MKSFTWIEAADVPAAIAAGAQRGALFKAGGQIEMYLAGALVAGVTAYLSTRLLLRYFRSGRLDPFALYCLVLGLIGLYAAR